jgi:hypothetical protein
MDDNRHDHTLDELADLFLTGRRPHDPAGKPPTAAGHDDDADAAPRGPIKLNPKPAAGRRAPGQAAGEDLQPPARRSTDRTGLRLAQPVVAPVNPRDDQTQPQAAPVAAEAVVLGNLPGLAGAWLTQHAQRLAQRHGPVLIVHADAGALELELVYPQRPGSGRDAAQDQALHDADELHHVLDLLAGGAAGDRLGRVLIHLDDSLAADTRDARLVHVGRGLLMTGTDGAALAAAARLIQRWTPGDDRPGLDRLHLVPVGNPLDQEAASLLAGEAGAALGRPVRMTAALDKMVPVSVRQLGGWDDGPAWDQLMTWLDAQVDAPAAPKAAPRPAPRQPDAAQKGSDPFSPPDAAEGTTTPIDANVGYDAAIDAAADIAQAWSNATAELVDDDPFAAVDARQPAAGEEGSESFSSAPRSAPQAEADADGDADRPDLAALLLREPRPTIPGGLALDARSPQHPQTQLVLDQDGRLHLLRATDSDDARAAILDLIQTRRWAHEHRALLQLTVRQTRMDTSLSPIVHLFTDRPDLASGLVHRLGGALRLHVLQRVAVGPHHTWVSIPVN